MSTIDRFLIKLNAQISQYVLPSTLKKVVTILVLALSIYYAYDRINRNRRRATQNRTANTAPTQRQPQSGTAAATALRSSSNATSVTSASSSSSVNRLLNSLAATSKDTLPLSPADKYLATHASPPRLVLIATSDVVLTATPSFAVVDSALPVLLQLARCCQLVLVSQVGEEAGEVRESEVRGALRRAGLMEAGLREHRVLFCSSAKGRVAIIRQLQPALAVDSDAEVVSLVRPHIVDVVHVTPTAPATFTPPTLTAANKLPPASASAGGSSRSLAAERRAWVVPSLHMFFHGGTHSTASLQ